MRVLLTGAGGFVGANALDALLARGCEVHAVARRPGAPRDGLTWHEADLLSSGAAETVAAAVRASHLLHLAWYAVPGSFWSAAENERWIDSSLRLLRAFGEAGGARAVGAGSCAEYAWGDALLSESDTALRPSTLYGACKHATHVAATAVAAQLGVSLAWGRIFFLFGPREDPQRLVSALARGLLQGDRVPTTDGSQQRDFMHVSDVAGGLVALLLSDVTGAVNIASGKAIAVREIATLVGEAAGALELVRFGALPQRPDEPPVIVASTTRLREDVGFVPTVSLQDGVVDTVAWWRARTPASPRPPT